MPVDNYDMGPSIARSDSFDVAHYDLVLDVTDYAGQSMQALATIDFTVLQGDGTSMWWDLKGLDVDSVHWNGAGTAFHQWGQELHVESPAPMVEGEAVTLQVWYGGQPDDDPYWGGMYYASDLVYNLGIATISAHFTSCEPAAEAFCITIATTSAAGGAATTSSAGGNTTAATEAGHLRAEAC